MKKRAFVYIIVAGLLWGTSGLFVRALTPYGFSPFQMTAVRGFVSFVCMAVYALIKDRRLWRIRPRDLLVCIGVGIGLYAAAGSYYNAMKFTTVSTAVVLMYTAPVFVAVASVIMFGEKMSKMKVAAIGVMLLGCCFVSGVIGGLDFNLMGILLSIGAGLAYALYNVLTKLTMRLSCHPVTVTVYGFLFMTVIAFCVSNPVDIVKTSVLAPLETLPLLLGLGVCTFVVPYFLYTLGMRELPAGTASALSIMEPMSATVFSAAFLGEKLTVYSVLGIVMILGAVFLLGREEE